jgi:hypothetical protein
MHTLLQQDARAPAAAAALDPLGRQPNNIKKRWQTSVSRLATSHNHNTPFIKPRHPPPPPPPLLQLPLPPLLLMMLLRSSLSIPCTPDITRPCTTVVGPTCCCCCCYVRLPNKRSIQPANSLHYRCGCCCCCCCHFLVQPAEALLHQAMHPSHLLLLLLLGKASHVAHRGPGRTSSG